MSELEKLYNSKEVPESEETKKASEKLWKCMNELHISKSELLELENFVLAHSIQNEKQGFLYGFQYAVSLLLSAKGDVA